MGLLHEDGAPKPGSPRLPLEGIRQWVYFEDRRLDDAACRRPEARMRVYGDRAATVAPRQLLRTITATLRAAEEFGPGPRRHDLLTSAFLDAAALLQGIADAELEASGHDDLTPPQDAATALALLLARKLAASAWSGFEAAGPGVTPELMELAIQPLPECLSIRTPEGFAFDAVYPEACLKAAAEHPWPATPLVVGLRSAGAGLAALVAAATGARKVLTLRPLGLPFRCEFRISGPIRALLAGHDGPIALAGDGPVPTDAFAAAAGLLKDLGVAEARIVFLPSHPGQPGRQADLGRRDRWAQLARPVASFADLVAEAPLDGWFADITGPVQWVEDLSAGAWRNDGRFSEPPPAHPAEERLKFRLHTASGKWLARFAGLGAVGEAKLDRAKALHRAGFTPEPLALRRGFLLERWEDAAPPAALPRERLVERLGAYLGFRAMAFPAEPFEGASREALAEMAEVNVREALGREAASGLLRALTRLVATPEGQRVHVDARLHPWEWLLTPDELILKADALDHSVGRDLVGAQEIAWDIAGATLEFELSADETAQIREAVRAATGERAHPGALLFCEICYSAFQAGYWRTAEGAAPAAERARLDGQANRYVRQLARLAQAAESSD